jgi:hypothetical protein
MKQATTRQLFDYWDRLRGGRVAPERAQVDPAQIRGVLGDTFMLEVDPERTFPIRLSGARTSALFQKELKGESFVRLFSQDDRIAVNQLLAAVVEEPAPAVAGVCASPLGRATLDLELLLLPLRHHGKTHARILGSLAPVSIPSWFGLVAADRLRLGSLRILADPPAGHGRSMLRPRPVSTGAPPIVSRHGHFTVYENPGMRTLE